MRKFETFTGRATPASRKVPRIAIQKKGNMSLNKAAFEALKSPDAVFLMFDKESKAVGIKPANPEERYTYPVRKQKGSESYMIGARAFCAHYEIETSHTTAFAPELEDGILVFELNKGVAIPIRKRNVKSKTS